MENRVPNDSDKNKDNSNKPYIPHVFIPGLQSILQYTFIHVCMYSCGVVKQIASNEK